ncbi:MAG: Uma2 family endonuclease, partial [Oscillatoriales cyanobacterium]
REGERVEFQSINLSLPIEQLYEEIIFDRQP